MCIGERKVNHYIFDIDGTLLDIRHRLHYIKGEKKDWKAFRDPTELAKDKPRIEIVQLALPFISSNEFVFASGRTEAERGATIGEQSPLYKALYRHNRFHSFPSSDDLSARLYMRKNDDYRADTIVKAEMLEQMRQDGLNPILAFDDRPSVIRMWREQGLAVADVGYGKEF
jgi:FMN phosphatase YigB (HAD superfamily)